MYTRTSGFSHYQRVFRAGGERAPYVSRRRCRAEAMRRSGVAGEVPAPAGWPANRRRGVAQLAEQRSPKPQVAGSSPVAPALRLMTMRAVSARGGIGPAMGDTGR